MHQPPIYFTDKRFIPFREFSRLLRINDIDEYIRYGGTLKAGETAFDDDDANEPDASFRDDESTRRYIDTAICQNIQHSLKCCRDGAYFRHLQSLYEAGELTGAINRIIESMNHQFLLRILTRKFKSHDLGSAAEVLRKQTDPDKRSDLLDTIDRTAVSERLMEILKIKNAENLKVGLTQTHADEIKQYLMALDLVVDCPRETVAADAPDLDYVLFTQPGMRYCQAQALLHKLNPTGHFCALDGGFLYGKVCILRYLCTGHCAVVWLLLRSEAEGATCQSDHDRRSVQHSARRMLHHCLYTNGVSARVDLSG